MGNFYDIRNSLTLTDDQARMYWKWVSKLSEDWAAEGEQLDEVCITFTFTPIGRWVVAHLGGSGDLTKPNCVLENALM